MHDVKETTTRLLRYGAAFGVACALFGGAGCADDDLDLDDDDAFGDGANGDAPVGFFTTQWMIAGATDASACEDFGADSVAISVFDDGFFVSSARVPCDQFDASLGLIEDDYTAEAVLLDDENVAISDVILIDQFSIVDDMETVVEISFDEDDLI